MSAVRFWKVREHAYQEEFRYASGWYWQDDDCDEPMGPFDSKVEAQTDYESLRKQSSETKR